MDADICDSRRWCTVCRREPEFRRQFSLPEVCPYGVTVESAPDQKPVYPAERIRRPGGPGTELAKLLARFGFAERPGCKCKSTAAKMDAWGPEECSKPGRIEEVLAVMAEEAKKRGLPFVPAVGRLLIRRAISVAAQRKLAVNQQQN
jgi:hypothetical protein